MTGRSGILRYEWCGDRAVRDGIIGLWSDVELAHRDGSIVRARMNSSALRTDTDPVALATFQDLTEHLWANEL